MKPFLLLITSLFLLLAASCGERSGRQVGKYDLSATSDTAEITFSVFEHDFGKVAEGEKVAAIFNFTNTGKGPLVIYSVSTSCGCTAPRYSRKPVAPGDSGSVEIVFDSSGFNGTQRKTATVTSNALHKHIILQIKAEVVPRM